MLSLPSDLDALCFSLFVRCDEFDSASLFRAVFTTTDLAPFADGLPEKTGNKKMFVTEVKAFLLETRLGLARVVVAVPRHLARQLPREHDLHGELNDLYRRVLARIQPAARAPNECSIPRASPPLILRRPVRYRPTRSSPAGRLADDTLFCGRERELRELTRICRPPPIRVLVGRKPRGQSSLLQQLIGHTRRLNPAPACLYMDMQEVENEEDFYELVLKKLGGTGNTWRAFDAMRAISSCWHLTGSRRRKRRSASALSYARVCVTRAEGLTLAITTRQPLDRLFTDSSGGTSPLYNLCQRYHVAPERGRDPEPDHHLSSPNWLAFWRG